jgi:hypothetical protein
MVWTILNEEKKMVLSLTCDAAHLKSGQQLMVADEQWPGVPLTSMVAAHLLTGPLTRERMSTNG